MRVGKWSKLAISFTALAVAASQLLVNTKRFLSRDRKGVVVTNFG
jgi:hypothetical protein